MKTVIISCLAGGGLALACGTEKGAPQKPGASRTASDADDGGDEGGTGPSPSPGASPRPGPASPGASIPTGTVPAGDDYALKQDYLTAGLAAAAVVADVGINATPCGDGSAAKPELAFGTVLKTAAGASVVCAPDEPANFAELVLVGGTKPTHYLGFGTFVYLGKKVYLRVELTLHANGDPGFRSSCTASSALSVLGAGVDVKTTAGVAELVADKPVCFTGGSDKVKAYLVSATDLTQVSIVMPNATRQTLSLVEFKK